MSRNRRKAGNFSGNLSEMPRGRPGGIHPACLLYTSNLGVKESDYTTFVQAIPFQIYAILAIILIPLIAFTKIDFSQMKKAEQRTEKEKAGYSFTEHAEEEESTGIYSKKNAKPIMVILPIVAVSYTHLYKMNLYGLLKKGYLNFLIKVELQLQSIWNIFLKKVN